MLNVDATNYYKDFFNYLQQTAKFNKPVTVSTEDGDVVVVRAEDYIDSLSDQEYIKSIPGLEESILASVNSPRSEFVDITGMTVDEIIALSEQDDLEQ